MTPYAHQHRSSQEARTRAAVVCTVATVMPMLHARADREQRQGRADFPEGIPLRRTPGSC